MPTDSEFTPEGNRLIKRRNEQGRVQTVLLSQLIPPPFMQKHTSFSSFDAMLSESTIDVTTKEDFLGLPAEEKDELISQQSPFDSWEEMKERAWEEWERSQSSA